MRINAVTYSEFRGEAQEWTLERFELGEKTLVVGRNSSGKSRILSIIANLARMLAGLQPPTLSGDYDCEFEHDGKIYKYALAYQNESVLRESLEISGKTVLKRGEGGVGEILAEQLNGDMLAFQSPPKDVAAISRRDLLQHSFLEPLYQWASEVRHYMFGSQLGKDIVNIHIPSAPSVDERDQNAVVGIFRKAVKEFGEPFKEAVKKDLHAVGYDVTEVDVGTPVTVRFGGLPGVPLGLYVREQGLAGITDQFGMSQGMYRVLALLVHVNYLRLRGAATCIIIDDIGEGLDYERSCQIIALLRKMAEESKLQILLSTNDRFVMNEVPLEEWAILQRTGSHVRVKNYKNSKEIFEEFKFTGLSNFSFFEINPFDESGN